MNEEKLDKIIEACYLSQVIATIVPNYDKNVIYIAQCIVCAGILNPLYHNTVLTLTQINLA